jgi:hypothetical protein
VKPAKKEVKEIKKPIKRQPEIIEDERDPFAPEKKKGDEESEEGATLDLDAMEDLLEPADEEEFSPDMDEEDSEESW